MNRFKVSLFLAVSAMSLQSFSPAQAADADYYFTVDAGANFERGSVTFIEGSEVLTKDSTKHHDLVWGFDAGVQLTRYFAVEIGYRNLGDISGALKNLSYAPTAAGSFRFSTGGPTVALVGTIPFGRWQADFKIGTLVADSHLSLDFANSAGTFGIQASGWNAGLLEEVGLNYRVNSRWSATLSASSYLGVGIVDKTGRWGLGATTVGATYRF